MVKLFIIIIGILILLSIYAIRIDHSITLVLFNERYQKVLNLLKKTLDYMERSNYVRERRRCEFNISSSK